MYLKFIMKVYLIVAILLALATVSYTQQCSVKDDEFFVTFHPHLDAFWLNYDNQLKDIKFRPQGFLYNMNQRNSKTIFNSMLEALLEKSSRKYFVTEVVFFKDWYLYLTPDKQSQVQQLLKKGQLQIGNAGWVENDEAVCYYDDILDQYTVGMNFLNTQFKYQSKVGWATDSFGHSHSQAALEHLLGIQFQGIERVDDRYVNQHKDEALLQFYWIPVSDSNNQTYGGVINQVRHFLHEVNNLRGQRTSFITGDFENLEKRMRDVYHKNKFFRFLGNDFEEFIPQQFKNLEGAFIELNKDHQSDCPMYKYGNPSDYLKSIEQYYSKNKLPTRKFDFIPNWDQDRFWTGYYTTDPQLKKVCKDFSRLINFYRKTLLSARDRGSESSNSDVLETAEQLLAVLQHHDGITATSKTYIQDQFKNRVGKKSKQIMKEINKIYYNVNEPLSQDSSEILVCELYRGNNMCKIPEQRKYSSLSIITLGNAKKEKIELELPVQQFYAISDTEYDIFCEDQINCKIVFDAVLFPGINEFKLVPKDRAEVAHEISELEVVTDMSHSGRDYSFSLDQGSRILRYEFHGEDYFNFGFFTSPNRGSSRQTMSWDKYGRKTDKTEHVMPGMYIMSNTGSIEKMDHQFSEMRVSEGKIYTKVVCKSNIVGRMEITIKPDNPNIIDVIFDFKPGSRAMQDYFLKVESPVKSDMLYHDSNGFLVAKRILNERPDYQYTFKKEDLINGNTYPACSFAYLINNGKKFVFSTDRAQGVAAYEKSLLINFDRLAMDDGKGVGQSYSNAVANTFHYRFAITKQKQTIERRWQREYDEGMIGYLSTGKRQINALGSTIHRNNYIEQTGLKYVKYSIFILNRDEIVLRLQNLGEFESVVLPLFKKSGKQFIWTIKDIGLDLTASDITESYANGIPLQKNQQWRKNWSEQPNQISNYMRAQSNGEFMSLRPLQLRSFRVNFKGSIQTNHPQEASTVTPQQPIQSQITPEPAHNEQLQGYHGFRMKCF